MAIYTITLTNEKTGEEISKRIFLFNRFERKDRPNFNTIIKEMRATFIKRVSAKFPF